MREREGEEKKKIDLETEKEREGIERSNVFGAFEIRDK